MQLLAVLHTTIRSSTAARSRHNYTADHSAAHRFAGIVYSVVGTADHEHPARRGERKISQTCERRTVAILIV